VSDFRFESPWALQLLWLLPLAYFFSKWALRRHGKILKQVLGEKLAPFLTSSVSDRRRRLKRGLELLALGCLIVAYARPQTSEGRQQVKNEGIEILILVDVSNSMLAEDVRPSRMELIKNELNRLIDSSGGDRMGLVAFAGSAVLLSPMTNDKDAIKMYIESLSPNAVSTQGTNFKAALNEAREAFRRGGLGDQEGGQVTRAILIASDGEDNEPGAIEEARKLKDEGIHIFTVGVGTEEGGAIPMQDAQGVLRGYKRGSDNQVILTKTKGTVLKDLAKVGEGSFHHATFQSEAMLAVRSDIEKLKKAQFESGEVASYNELFVVFLWLALVLATVEVLLGDRKARGRIWKGRFEVASE
jgi:Ca-activated chloride channel family protein